MLNQWSGDAIPFTKMPMVKVAGQWMIAALMITAVPALAAENTLFNSSLVELSVRGHYEDVNASNLPNASGATLRTTLELRTPEISFSQFSLELLNVTTLTSSNFSNGVRHKGTAVIADPDVTEVNQAFFRFSGIPRSIIQIGRQVIELDNERFIGSVSFRQNPQTFDALSLLTKPHPDWSIYYAHLRAVNTVLGQKAINGRRRQDSDLINIQYQFADNASATAYHYAIRDHALTQLDLDTSGVRLNGSLPFAPLAPAGTLEFARQSPRTGNDTGYALAELSVKLGPVRLIGGFELLGADAGTAFQTPLATVHKFQGFTDLFTTTPASGLRDRYVTLQSNVGPGRIELTHHRFRADEGSSDFGEETSIGAWYRLGENGSLLIKWAHFNDAIADNNTRKYWLQLGYDF